MCLGKENILNPVHGALDTLAQTFAEMYWQNKFRKLK